MAVGDDVTFSQLALKVAKRTQSVFHTVGVDEPYAAHLCVGSERGVPPPHQGLWVKQQCTVGFIEPVAQGILRQRMLERRRGPHYTRYAGSCGLRVRNPFRSPGGEATACSAFDSSSRMPRRLWTSSPLSRSVPFSRSISAPVAGRRVAGSVLSWDAGRFQGPCPLWSR